MRPLNTLLAVCRSDAWVSAAWFWSRDLKWGLLLTSSTRSTQPFDLAFDLTGTPDGGAWFLNPPLALLGMGPAGLDFRAAAK
jgi:hypothetical protein